MEVIAVLLAQIQYAIVKAPAIMGINANFLSVLLTTAKMVVHAQLSMVNPFVIVPILDLGANSVRSQFVDLVSVSMEVDALFRIVGRFVIVVTRVT